MVHLINKALNSCKCGSLFSAVKYVFFAFHNFLQMFRFILIRSKFIILITSYMSFSYHFDSMMVFRVG